LLVLVCVDCESGGVRGIPPDDLLGTFQSFEKYLAPEGETLLPPRRAKQLQKSNKKTVPGHPGDGFAVY